MFNKFWGRAVEIVDIDDRKWIGYVAGIESPADSDDNQWWLDVEVPDPGFKTCLAISESEIKQIKIIN